MEVVCSSASFSFQWWEHAHEGPPCITRRSCYQDLRTGRTETKTSNQKGVQRKCNIWLVLTTTLVPQSSKEHIFYKHLKIFLALAKISNILTFCFCHYSPLLHWQKQSTPIFSSRVFEVIWFWPGFNLFKCKLRRAKTATNSLLLSMEWYRTYKM